MALTRYERENSWKTYVEFKSGSTFIDPSGNLAYLTITKPDGTKLIDNISGARQSTGVYKYYVSTQSTDPLGLYVISWYGEFNYSGRWGYMPKYEKEVIQLVKVVQA